MIPIVVGAWMLRPAFSARAMTAPAIVVLCTALTILPWTVRNQIEFGRFVPLTSSLGFALAGTYNQESLDDDAHPGSWRTPVVTSEYGALFHTAGIDEGTLDATLRSHALRFAWDHPSYVAEVTGDNLLRLFEVAGGSVVGAHNVGGQLVADPRVVAVGRGIGSATPAAERIGLVLAGVLALLGVAAIVRSRPRPGADRDGAEARAARPVVPLAGPDRDDRRRGAGQRTAPLSHPGRPLPPDPGGDRAPLDLGPGVGARAEGGSPA